MCFDASFEHIYVSSSGNFSSGNKAFSTFEPTPLFLVEIEKRERESEAYVPYIHMYSIYASLKGTLFSFSNGKKGVGC